MPLVKVPEFYLSSSYWEDQMLGAVKAFKTQHSPEKIVREFFIMQTDAVLTIYLTARQQVRIIKILCKARDHVLYIVSHGKEGKCS
jgi:hypothetical protein